jgi:tetratricopeptide (TPR) repeat protein
MLAEIGELSLAQQVLRRLEGFTQSGLGGNVFTGAVAHMKGEIAWAQGQKQSARDYLSQASAQWPDVLTLWSLGRVTEDLGDFQSASGAYRQILDRNGEVIRLYFPALRSLALARAAHCELALGHGDKARKYYDEFFTTLGKHAPDINVVQEARRSLEQLHQN